METTTYFLHKACDRAYLEHLLKEVGHPDWRVEQNNNGLRCLDEKGALLGTVKAAPDDFSPPRYTPKIGETPIPNRTTPADLRQWIIAIARGNP